MHSHRHAGSDDVGHEGTGDEVEEGPHHPIVPMDLSTNRGF